MRRYALAFASAAFLATLLPCEALASLVVVPDDAPSVQAGIDTWADTVLVRPGAYPESPAIDHPVVLGAAEPGTRPRLGGLSISNANFWYYPRTLAVDGVSFAGAVRYKSVSYDIRTLKLTFDRSTLDMGVQVDILDMEDISGLLIRNCLLGGVSSGAVSAFLMDADTISGGTSWRVFSGGGVEITNCWFRGGNEAIRLIGGPRGRVESNRIEGYAVGLYAEDADDLMVIDNVIRCSVGIRLQSGLLSVVAGNDVRAGDIGIDVHTVHASVAGNTVIGFRSHGIWADETTYLTIEQNVVGWCGGSGIQIDRPWYVIDARNNTTFENGGSGIALDSRTIRPISVKNNIGYGNGQWGLNVVPGGVVALGCNDWFGNALGTVAGVTGDSSELAVDPVFCNLDSADLRLDAASPLLADSAACGQIGALGVGCGVTPTLVQRFTAGRVSVGIQVVWEVAEGATASAVWVERSEGSSEGPWVRPVTERSIDNRAVVELDRSADPYRAYWYRLMAQEGSQTVVIGAPIVVEAQAPLEFRLVQVGPSPGNGPVGIAFALKKTAAIEIDVFDVQGRKVASPASGVWAAGTHELAWDGRTRNGQPAPAGLYVIRYLYPGGQDRRGIVRIR